jgi:hypothetical protein
MQRTTNVEIVGPVEDGQTKVGGELRVTTVGSDDCLVKDIRQYKWIEQFSLMS